MKHNYLIAGLVLTTLLTGSIHLAQAEDSVSSSIRVEDKPVRVNAEARMELRNEKPPRLEGTSTKGTSTPKRITSAQEKAAKEIDRRVAALNKLKTRINDIAKLTASQKADFSAQIDAQISSLTTLKAKIAADTDAATLKTDIQSITGSYRIFALVLPQIEIIAAADRILSVADSMSALTTKLQAKITEAQTAGKDVTAMQSALADYTVKVSDAKVSAQAAIDGVISLKPDAKDQTIFEANRKTLAAARAKIKTATEALKAARKDAGVIVGKPVKSEPVSSPVKSIKKLDSATAEVRSSATVDATAATTQ